MQHECISCAYYFDFIMGLTISSGVVMIIGTSLILSLQQVSKSISYHSNKFISGCCDGNNISQ